MDRIEVTIFRNLVNNSDFVQTAYPFLRSDYFHSAVDRRIFDHISEYITKFSVSPTIEALTISLQNDMSIPEHDFSEAVETVTTLTPVHGTSKEWLMEEAETFCRNKAIHNAIMQSIKIIDGQDKDFKPDAIPTLLSDALSVCFDTNVGHDFFENAASRFAHYHLKEEKMPFDIDYFNAVTEGGLPKKTLTCLLAGTNVGKSLIMCHMAASYLASGKNVLYITMEMSELVTSLRIDANLLDTEIKQVKNLSESKFMSKIKTLHEKNNGRLIVKEYPTSGAHVGHFKALISELKLKKNFVPDIVFVDYLNICLSQRVKGANANSYTIVKSIAEELRGLAVMCGFPIVTATQAIRSANGSSDLSITDVSESIGLASTVDMLLGVIRTPELDEQNQLLFKLLKSRFVDAASYAPFLVGVDRSKMKLYDLEHTANRSEGNQPSTAPVSAPSFSGSSFKKSADMKFDNFKF